MNIPDSEKKFLADCKFNIPEISKLKWETRNFGSCAFYAKNGHISRLSLRELDLTELPTSIGNLKELQILLLNGHLTSLPESFQNLTNLEELGLNGNDFISLPDWFGNLKNLENLDIGGNNLHSLPESFGKLEKLTWIFLGDNKISILPDSFKNLKNLQYIGLEGAGLRSFSNFPEVLADRIDPVEDTWPWPDFLSEGNYPSRHANEKFEKLGYIVNDFWAYYRVSLIELAQKYAQDQESLTHQEKDRLAWEGGYQERDVIELGVEPDDPILAEINKRLTITCNNGLELIR